MSGKASPRAEVPCAGCRRCCIGDAVRILPHEDASQWDTEPHFKIPGARQLAHDPRQGAAAMPGNGLPEHCADVDVHKDPENPRLAAYLAAGAGVVGRWGVRREMGGALWPAGAEVAGPVRGVQAVGGTSGVGEAVAAGGVVGLFAAVGVEVDGAEQAAGGRGWLDLGAARRLDGVQSFGADGVVEVGQHAIAVFAGGRGGGGEQQQQEHRGAGHGTASGGMLTGRDYSRYSQFAPDASGAGSGNPLDQGAQPLFVRARAFFTPVVCLPSYGGRCEGTRKRGRFLDPVFPPLASSAALLCGKRRDGSRFQSRSPL